MAYNPVPLGYQKMDADGWGGGGFCSPKRVSVILETEQIWNDEAKSEIFKYFDRKSGVNCLEFGNRLTDIPYRPYSMNGNQLATTATLQMEVSIQRDILQAPPVAGGLRFGKETFL